jgi:hypothetical protein
MKQFKSPKSESEPSERASSFYKELIKGKSFETLDYLYSRWMDERGHEDIKDYQKPLDPVAAEYGVEIVNMNKRPFGFNFKADGRTYQFKMLSRNAEYRRIA